jgi:hypothetical protein
MTPEKLDFTIKKIELRLQQNSLSSLIKKLIKQCARRWGNPNIVTPPSNYEYPFSELTDGKLIIKPNENHRICGYINDEYIGYINVIYDEEEINDPRIEFIKSTSINIYDDVLGDLIITNDMVTNVYDILMVILCKDFEKTKLKFEKIEFESFYGTT